ncbi:MAG: HD domain-containing phosphohydrolase [Elusimicrobiota bacterium]
MANDITQDTAKEAAQDAAPEIGVRDLLAAWYRRYVERHFERAFVVVTLAAIISIGYFVENKLAFISFFYIPVFFAAFLINSRTAVLQSVFSVLMVSLYAIVVPEKFFMEPTSFNLFFHLLAWGSFLILAGAVVGRLNEKLSERYRKSESLVVDLKEKQRKLETLQKSLVDSNQNLELKNRAVESLKEKLEGVLYSAIDPEVARLVVNRQIMTEKKFITVLFADLQGFTQYSEARQPEVVIEELNKYFTVMEPVIARFRGHLDKYIGDGVMAEFGAPLHFQQHPVLGVLAALQMQARAPEARLPLKMRIGVASGPAIVGLVGSARRKNYSAFGDTVNVAQRLEMMCPSGSVLIDQATFEKASRFIRYRRVRMGLDAEKSEQLEQRIEELEKSLASGKAKPESWIEAGKLASQLGEMDMAIRHLREAMRQLPDRRVEIEKALAEAVFMSEERSKIEVKGKTRRVTTYEVLGLRDPLLDPNKFPPAFNKRYGKLEPTLNGGREILLSIEALDGSLGQSRSTALLSYALAEAMELDGETKELVLQAGHLHHVGKRFIPEHLLNREDSDYDLQVMTGHVNEAEKVIQEMGLEVSDKVIEAIRHHHESYGGGGYPSGLKGEDIPLGSRIIQLASHYDTLTSWKAYREAWNRKAALSELKREAELARFDPKVVKALATVLKD